MSILSLAGNTDTFARYISELVYNFWKLGVAQWFVSASIKLNMLFMVLKTHLDSEMEGLSFEMGNLPEVCKQTPGLFPTRP